MFFFVPETQYNRAQRLNIDETMEGEMAVVEKAGHGAVSHVDRPKLAETTTHEALSAKKTYVQGLAVYTGTYTQENLFQLILAPFVSCTNLAVTWIIITSGTITATYVAQAIILAQIFSPPPYLLTPTGIGNLFLGPFIGCVICTIVVGSLNDVFIKFCARKNNGVYEPEYRLLLTIIGLTAGVGLMVFGYLCQQ